MQINQEDILGWRNHKDYFTVSNKRSPSFKMIKPKIDKIIIQNSWPLIFDPISGNIYEEKYRISISDDNENLIDVLKNIIANANLFENESFFLSCSGYWSIIDSSSYYVGSGENGLLLSSSKVKTGEFGISYCSRDFILIVSGKIINYQITNVLELHLICTNYYLPFADILFPFRKSLKKYDNFKWLGALDYPNKIREFLTEIDVYVLLSGIDMAPLT